MDEDYLADVVARARRGILRVASATATPRASLLATTNFYGVLRRAGIDPADLEPIAFAATPLVEAARTSSDAVRLPRPRPAIPRSSAREGLSRVFRLLTDAVEADDVEAWARLSLRFSEYLNRGGAPLGDEKVDHVPLLLGGRVKWVAAPYEITTSERAAA